MLNWKRQRRGPGATVLKKGVLAFTALLWVFTQGEARGQLLEHLEAFGNRLAAGDPVVESVWEGGTEGPKGIAAGDLDRNGSTDFAVSNLDGTVTVYRNRGDGTFFEPVHLRTRRSTLRGIVLADLTPQDGTGPDILTCALGNEQEAGAVVIFPSLGAGRFGPPLSVETWPYARDLAAGDFDHDGQVELAVAGAGVCLRIYDRPDRTGPFVGVKDFTSYIGPVDGDSKPVFSLRSYRDPRRPWDFLAVTHAWAERVFILGRSDISPEIILRGVVDDVRGVYDLDVAPVIGPSSGGLPDLITVHRNDGTIQIRRSSVLPGQFEVAVDQEIRVRGGPRAARVASLNGDDWNDLVVVLRDMDRVVTYANHGGQLQAVAEMPVGRSPRDLACGHFNRDGQMDVTVINRLSSDVSVLTAYPGTAGFAALDQLYFVDVMPVALRVRDLDGDGRDDVVQLHRFTDDVTIRLARPGGILGFPTHYTMGTFPEGLVIEDVNADGFPDIVTANLGRARLESGSVSVRINDGAGGLLEENRTEFPPELLARPARIEAVDLDLDSLPDLVVGFLDNRIAFLRNLGAGQFSCPDAGTACHRIHEAVPGLVALVAADFDQDLDLDIALAGIEGTVELLENDGTLLDAQQLPPAVVVNSRPLYGVRDLLARDIDGDLAPDLILSAEQGVEVFLNQGLLQFTTAEDLVQGTALYQESSVVSADFDGDSRADLAVAGRVLQTLTVLTRNESGDYVPALVTDVPSASLLAVGDLDGDGMSDLVGSGEVLWTGLSSRGPNESGPLAPELERERIPHLVINELMALNSIHLFAPEGKSWDWVELFNGAPAGVPPLSLGGYTLVRKRPGADGEDVYPLPQTQLESGEHVLLYCTNSAELPFHTGFKLPAEGAILILRDAGGEELDRVEFPPQRRDVAFARYSDALGAFIYNPIGTPGAPNLYSGLLPPRIKLEAIAADSWTFGEPLRMPSVPQAGQEGEALRFYAVATDDVGVAIVRVFYGDPDAASFRRRWVTLYDDGQHRDGALRDGLFSGSVPYESFFPDDGGGGSCVAVEVEDVDGEITVAPENPEVGDISGRTEAYCVQLEYEVPYVRISEVVSRNLYSWTDEEGGSPDYVELWNPHGASTGGLFLGERFPDDNGFSFPPGDGPADEHIMVACDRNPDQGPFHTEFELSGEEGGQLVLLYGVPMGPRVAYALVDSVAYPPLETDQAWARVGGEWRYASPSPSSANPLLTARYGDVDASGSPGAVDIADAIGVLLHLYGGRPVICPPAADVNFDGNVDTTDVVRILLFLFWRGAPLPDQYVECY